MNFDYYFIVNILKYQLVERFGRWYIELFNFSLFFVIDILEGGIEGFFLRI